LIDLSNLLIPQQMRPPSERTTESYGFGLPHRFGEGSAFVRHGAVAIFGATGQHDALL
jgi:hypothetical protein